MARRKNDGRQDEYTAYARLCLKAAELATDRETRIAQREMAAEWLRLAEQAGMDETMAGGMASRKGNGKSEAAS